MIMAYKTMPRPVHVCNCGDHAWTSITKGHVTLVSPEDAHFLERRAWCIRNTKLRKNNLYAGSRTGKTVHRLHRLILGLSPDQIVDHCNGNGLDNRRSNLRQCTFVENSGNSRQKNPHGFRGITRSGKGWMAQIGNHAIGTYLHLGYYLNKEDAALAYDREARKRFGEFAKLNFPKPPCPSP
jgi:hypothetical protein